jgi:hypothetical protein
MAHAQVIAGPCLVRVPRRQARPCPRWPPPSGMGPCSLTSRWSSSPGRWRWWRTTWPVGRSSSPALAPGGGPAPVHGGGASPSTQPIRCGPTRQAAPYAKMACSRAADSRRRLVWGRELRSASPASPQPASAAATGGSVANDTPEACAARTGVQRCSSTPLHQQPHQQPPARHLSASPWDAPRGPPRLVLETFRARRLSPLHTCLGTTARRGGLNGLR